MEEQRRMFPRMYCVCCGDPIDPGEMVCDKCGYKFQVVQGVPQGTTQQMNIYVNPVPRQGRPTPQQGRPAPQQVRPMPQQSRPMPQQGYPQNARAVQKKKKSKTWIWITLAAAAACMFLLVLFGGAVLFTGMLLFSESENIAVVDEVPETPAVATSGIVVAPSEPVKIDGVRERYVSLLGDNKDKVTVMIYMNGSDLESNDGSATNDISEILSANLSPNTNVIIETGGTKKWKNQSISEKETQRYLVYDHKLVLLSENLGQQDITDEQTLEDFIVFCKDNYPANRNMLIMWDHGGGPIYGFGHDEWVKDEYASLTMDEVQSAINDSNVKFEMIGFDACLMGGLETAYILRNCADYLIASEDFESGYGWEYQNWLTILGVNSSTPMTEVAKLIIDDFVAETIECNDKGVLALIDLRFVDPLFEEWSTMAYANQDTLLQYNYSMEMERSERASRFQKPQKSDFMDGFFSSSDSYSIEEYSAVDLMALSSVLPAEDAENLTNHMQAALVYVNASTEDASTMCGMSVTLPYGDSSIYSEMERVFANCGFSNDYLTFLSYFSTEDNTDYYDWDDSDWSGWWDYEDYGYDGYYDDGYYYGDDYYYEDGYYEDGYYDDGYYYDDGGCEPN